MSSLERLLKQNPQKYSKGKSYFRKSHNERSNPRDVINQVIANTPIRNRSDSIFKTQTDPKIKQKQIELAVFLNRVNYGLPSIPERDDYIFFHPAIEELPDETLEIIDKYKKYYSTSNFNLAGWIPTEDGRLSLTRLDNDIRYGFTLKGNTRYLNTNKELFMELFKERHSALQDCLEHIPEQYREIVKAKENEIFEFIKKFPKLRMEDLITYMCINIVWGESNFGNRTDGRCSNFKFTFPKSDGFRQTIYGWGEDYEPFIGCKYLRAKGMWDKSLNNTDRKPCSIYFEWSRWLNKMYTFCSANSYDPKYNLFPVRLIKPDTHDLKYKLKVDITELFRDYTFLGLITVYFNDNRRTGGRRGGKSYLYLLLFYGEEKRVDYLHSTWTNFKIVTLDGFNVPIGLLFKEKGITYDEINMFTYYLDMTFYQYQDSNIFFLSKAKDIDNRSKYSNYWNGNEDEMIHLKRYDMTTDKIFSHK